MKKDFVKGLSEFAGGLLLGLVLCAGAVSCTGKYNDHLLEQDKIELEQRYKDGLITFDEYLSVKRQWEKNQ